MTAWRPWGLGWADKVEDWGDEAASDLGATPGEQQLGQTDQANELVNGNPGVIRSSAKHLTDFGKAFDKVGEGMRKLDSSRWKGEAASTFREKFATHPSKWLHAADACEAAGKTLDAYAETVKWAQGQAQEAIDLYKQGKKASEQAVESYNKRVDAYNVAIKADKDPGPPLEPFKDPGRGDIERARQILAEARRQRNEAGRLASEAVKSALKHAPEEPPPLDRLQANVLDGGLAVTTELTHVVGGAVKGTAGLVNFVRGLNPLDLYNITHPAAYLQNVSMTLSGLTSTVAHPERIPPGACGELQEGSVGVHRQADPRADRHQGCGNGSHRSTHGFEGRLGEQCDAHGFQRFRRSQTSGCRRGEFRTEGLE